MKKQKVKNLTLKATVEVIPSFPFNFDTTVYKPAHFPTNDTYWERGKRWQTMLLPSEVLTKEGKLNQCLGLVIENKGTVMKPKVHLHIYSKEKLTDNFLESIKKEIIYR